MTSQALASQANGIPEEINGLRMTRQRQEIYKLLMGER